MCQILLHVGTHLCFTIFRKVSSIVIIILILERGNQDLGNLS